MKVYAVTILGSPAAECAHFGICKVESLPPEQWISFQPQHVRHAKAIISRSIKNGLLHFEFPFSEMRADTRNRFFPVDGFRIDSPGHFLIGTTAYIIGPGLYPLVFSAEGVLLVVETICEDIRKEPDVLKYRQPVALCIVS